MLQHWWTKLRNCLSPSQPSVDKLCYILGGSHSFTEGLGTALPKLPACLPAQLPETLPSSINTQMERKDSSNTCAAFQQSWQKGQGRGTQHTADTESAASAHRRCLVWNKEEGSGSLAQQHNTSPPSCSSDANFRDQCPNRSLESLRKLYDSWVLQGWLWHRRQNKEHPK